MLTLANIQTTRFQTVTGYGTASSDFLELLNDAVAELMRRGDWADVVFPINISICPVYGTITWPNWVGEVRKMNFCRNREGMMRNVWYEFLPREGRRWNNWDSWNGWSHRNVDVDAQGRSPIVNNIPGAGYNLQFVATESADIGATCTVFGTDNSGNPLQTQNGDGTWSPGITIVANQPYGSNATLVSTIYRVVMTATNSIKTLQAYNATTASTQVLATYAATETNPSFLRYKLRGIWPCCPTQCLWVTALIKLAILPIQNPQDLIPINNRNALLDALKAQKLDDAGDAAGAAIKWKMAVERLNRQLEDSSPEEQTAVANNTFSTPEVWGNQAF